MRGPALLSILMINIQSFALIAAACKNPMAFGDLAYLNRAIYYFLILFSIKKLYSYMSLNLAHEFKLKAAAATLIIVASQHSIAREWLH